MVLNRTTQGNDFGNKRQMAASPTLARRFFRPLAPKAMEQQVKSRSKIKGNWGIYNIQIVSLLFLKNEKKCYVY
jgi:hypothetical protein